MARCNFPLMTLFLLMAISVDGLTDPCYLWKDSSYVGLDTCYRVFFDQQPLTFTEAQTLCESHDDSTLVEVRTNQHWEELLRLMVHKNVTHHVWLGGRSTEANATTRWLSDSDPVNVSKTWRGFELRNVSNSEKDTCLALGLAHTLNNLLCSDRLEGFVCQKRVDNPCRHFLSDAEYFGENCFLPVREKLTVCEAMSRCEAKGAKVIEPDTEDMKRFAKLFADSYFESQDNITIGCSKSSKSNNFQWIVSGNLTEDADWARGEPNGMHSGDVIVQMLGSENWQWRVAPKTANAYTVCQKDISNLCEGILVNGSCLVLQNSSLGWLDGKAQCEKHGFHLIEPKTDQLKMALIRLLEDAGVKGNILTGAATGVDDEETENFRWVYSGDEYSGAGLSGIWRKNRQHRFCLVWNAKEKILVPQDFGIPSQFVCQKDLITYSYTYIATIPSACAGDDQNFDSTSSCIFPASSAPLYTTITTWVALSAAHPVNGSGSSPIHIRLFLQESSKPVSSMDSNINMAMTFEEIVIQPRGGFYRSFNLTDLVRNGSDVQNTYFLVQSTTYISLVLTVWREIGSDVTSVCSSLVFPVGWGYKENSSFFTHASSVEETTVDVISTTMSLTTLDFIASGSNESMTFNFGDYKVEGRSSTKFSTTLARLFEITQFTQKSGSDNSLFIHSDNGVGGFRSSRNIEAKDATFEQILPVSLVGSDYVTFPSFPADQSTDSTDLFTAVAVFNDTLIQVLDFNITLENAGDTANFNLPGTGFHYVTGDKPFYLYARLRAEYNGPTSSKANTRKKVGFCSVILLPSTLWRSVYTFYMSGPLLAMEVYIAMVVLEDGFLDRAKVKVWDDAHTEYIPTTCQKVQGTRYVGCYLRLPQQRLLCSIGDPEEHPLAAYMFARAHGTATCRQLGVQENLATGTHLEFVAVAYMEFMQNAAYCPQSGPLPDVLETTIDPPPICSFSNMTREKAMQKSMKLKRELKIDVRKTSSFHRKKKSVSDFRQSSVSVGVITIVFVSLPFILVIAVDAHSLVLFLVKYFSKHKK